jgi:hypothetical protein
MEVKPSDVIKRKARRSRWAFDVMLELDDVVLANQRTEEAMTGIAALRLVRILGMVVCVLVIDEGCCYEYPITVEYMTVDHDRVQNCLVQKLYSF